MSYYRFEIGDTVVVSQNMDDHNETRRRFGWSSLIEEMMGKTVEIMDTYMYADSYAVEYDGKVIIFDGDSFDRMVPASMYGRKRRDRMNESARRKDPRMYMFEAGDEVTFAEDCVEENRVKRWYNVEYPDNNPCSCGMRGTPGRKRKVRSISKIWYDVNGVWLVELEGGLLYDNYGFEPKYGGIEQMYGKRRKDRLSENATDYIYKNGDRVVLNYDTPLAYKDVLSANVGDKVGTVTGRDGGYYVVLFDRCDLPNYYGVNGQIGLGLFEPSEITAAKPSYGSRRKSRLNEKMGVSERVDELTDVIHHILKQMVPWNKEVNKKDEYLIPAKVNNVYVNTNFSKFDDILGRYKNVYIEYNPKGKTMIGRISDDTIGHAAHVGWINNKTKEEWSDLNIFVRNLNKENLAHEVRHALQYSRDTTRKEKKLDVSTMLDINSNIEAFNFFLYLTEDKEIEARIQEFYTMVKESKPKDRDEFIKLLHSQIHYGNITKLMNGYLLKALPLDDPYTVKFVSMWKHLYELSTGKRLSLLEMTFEPYMNKWLMKKFRQAMFKLGAYPRVSKEEANSFVEKWNKYLMKKAKKQYRGWTKLAAFM